MHHDESACEARERRREDSQEDKLQKRGEQRSPWRSAGWEKINAQQEAFSSKKQHWHQVFFSYPVLYQTESMDSYISIFLDDTCIKIMCPTLGKVQREDDFR